MLPNMATRAQIRSAISLKNALPVRPIKKGCAKGRFNCPIWICWASALPLKRRAVESPQVFQLTIAAGFGPMPAKSQKARIRRRAIGKSQVCPVSFDWGYFPETEPCFPPDLIEKFVVEAGLPGILGNKHASGTTIIAELGEEHIKSGKPICYTSADSVFQIAAHEEHFA